MTSAAMTLTLSPFSPAECVAAVATRMADFFESKEALGGRYGARYAELWAAARHSSEGGKKFRPALVVNSYQSLGGDRQDDVVVVATAFELLHTAFLLHDDVIDGDTVRRGRLNLAGALSASASRAGARESAAARWGEAAAILAGDLLLHAAQAQIARLNTSEVTRSALLDLLDECLFVTAAGELADVAFSTGTESPGFSDVLSMTGWKTARYSFQAPLQAGAVLAGASGAILTALGEYGDHIGLAFQLRDDILGVFGTEDLTGKSAVSDLREGKMTALMCHALRHEDTGELRQLLASDVVTDPIADRIRQILVRNGARDFIESLIEDQTRLALAALDSSAIPPALLEQLVEVAQKACERSS